VSAFDDIGKAFEHMEAGVRDAEPREVAARLLEVDPAFTISVWVARGGQSNAKMVIEGLRKAGLPE
jgi:adenylate cyclase